MCRILIVDDEVSALTLLGIILERGGFEVAKATTADTTLAIIHAFEPQAIIIDVMMPGTDGIQLCAMIRNLERFADTPILLISARGDVETVTRGLEAGATDYLPKPIAQHLLREKVSDLVKIASR